MQRLILAALTGLATSVFCAVTFAIIYAIVNMYVTGHGGELYNPVVWTAGAETRFLDLLFVASTLIPGIFMFFVVLNAGDKGA